jgi:hypothetical protein
MVSFDDGDYYSLPNDNVEWAHDMAGEVWFHVMLS